MKWMEIKKDLLERKIESDLTKVDTLKRNDEEYSLYLSNGEVKAIRSRWFPSGISPLEYLEDGRFEKFRDETTVRFIQDISNSISTHSRQLTRPVLEHCVRVINQDLSSGKLS